MPILLRGSFPKPGLKMGRTALPGHGYSPLSVGNANALQNYLKNQVKTASLKTPSPNIILDSMMVLNETTLSAFFEKVSAASGPAVPAPISSPTVSMKASATANVQTQQRPPQPPQQPVTAIKPVRSQPLAKDSMSYGNKGGMARYQKGSSIPALVKA